MIGKFYTAIEKKLSNPDILGTVPAEKDPDFPESAFPVRCNQQLKAIKGRTGVLSRIPFFVSKTALLIGFIEWSLPLRIPQI